MMDGDDWRTTNEMTPSSDVELLFAQKQAPLYTCPKQKSSFRRGFFR
jgi:hypothetical protein